MSAVASSAYRSRERIEDERIAGNNDTIRAGGDVRHAEQNPEANKLRNAIFDYTGKAGDLELSEILLPDGLPDRLRDRGTLWNYVEQRLTAWNAQPAFEVEVALPRELGREECAQLVREFATKHFVREGLVVDLNIHRPQASDGGEHPHAHMLITTRRWNPDGTLGRVARDLQDNPKLLNKIYKMEEGGQLAEALVLLKGTNLARFREDWATVQNGYLERAEAVDRVDHRTLKAQKIARDPIPHMGLGIYKGLDTLKGWIADRVGAFKELTQMRDLRRQFDRIQTTRKDLTAEFMVMAREYASDLADSFSKDEQQRSERGGEYDR